jgi:integrase
MPLELYIRGGSYWVRGRAADGDEYVRQSLGTFDPTIAAAAVREIEAAARRRRILGPDAPAPHDEITFSACVLLYSAGKRDAGYLKPIVRRIGKKRRAEITPQFVRALAKSMMPMASTDTWQRQIITPIRAVINNAHELGKCPPIRIKAFDRNERLEQDRIRGKESRVAKVPGSWPWLLAFCEEAEPRDAAIAYFMFRHGHRLSQTMAMTRSKDMDLSAGKVRVHAAKGHPAVWVDLDPEEVAMIANLPVPYRGQAKDRVFCIAGGRSGAFYARWKETCERAGIEYLPPHAAGRHGYGTEMIVRQKIDPVTAAKDRWSDPSVMLRTYAHPEDSEAKVRDAFKAGKAAARTQQVQANIAKRAKALPRKAK